MDRLILLTSGKIGPLTPRNRMIQVVAFKSIHPGDVSPEQLFNYRTSVAAGGTGVTSITHAAMAQSSLSFECRLWMRPDIISGLRKLIDTIHREGVVASIQLGYCDNVPYKRICGCIPVSTSSGFNSYSPMVTRGMRQSEIVSMVRAYGEVTRLAREVGMGAVEVHAGHGYLIGQFLSPYTNHRGGEYGGSPENRMRFMRMCMEEVMKAAGSDMAVTVKASMRNGPKGGLEIGECLEVTRTLRGQYGTHALVLSGGSVSRVPIYAMRGEMSIRTVAYYVPRGYLPIGIRMVDRYMIPSGPFKEACFLEDALKFRKTLRLPPIYIGGLVSRDKVEEVLNDGFEFVAIARALVNEPGPVSHTKEDKHARCDCGHSNYCTAYMYNEDMVCHKNVKGLPERITYETKRPECK